MVKKKRASKRRTLKDKYKIQKRVTQHHKKLRKEEKLKTNSGKKKKFVKDPGIPNLWPFKEELLKSIEAKKSKDEEERKQKRLEAKERKKSGPSMEELEDAVERNENFEKKMEEEEEEDKTGNQKIQYMRELREVVETSDVLLQVLDARDPEGCRAKELENMVVQHPSGTKRLVLVLNKIDLIPPRIAIIWLQRLRQEFPTIAFKASTQHQRSNLSQKQGNVVNLSDHDIATSSTLGADDLLQLLKNYSRNQKMKTAITVGVVGYPNVGKSSLINSLKRSRAVSVSSTPGHTKSLQVVHIDKKVKVIDSPGVLFAGKNETDSLALRNCLDPSAIEDPLQTVTALIGKCSKDQLMQVFAVERFSTPEQFLGLVSRKRGKLLKGGIPDLKAAARQVLQDWNAGKVPFYSLPSEEEGDEGNNKTTQYTNKQLKEKAEIVNQWSKEFDIDALLEREDIAIQVEGKPEDECIGMEL